MGLLGNARERVPDGPLAGALHRMGRAREVEPLECNALEQPAAKAMPRALSPAKLTSTAKIHGSAVLPTIGRR